MKRIRPFLLPTLLIVLALTARLLPGPRTIDDSYITFRYARNLLAGEGFTFNPGERVQGTTTPLYTLLMAGLALPTGGTNAPFPLLALGLNAAADAATCIVLWQLGKRAGSPLAGAAAGLVWAIAPFSVTFAIGGLETSVYVLLLTACVLAYLEKKRATTTLLAALALLTRPDALLLVGPLALDRLARAFLPRDPIKREPLTLREVLAFALPVAAWFGFAWIYFGSPIAHSVQAKLVTYRLESGESLIRMLQHYATPFLENNWLGGVAVGIGLVLYPFLYILGARRAWKAEPRLLAWLVYPWVYFLAFVLPNPLLFRWYLTPPLPAYFLFILMGLEPILRGLIGFIGKRLKLQTQATGWITAALLISFPFCSSLGEWTLRPDHGPQTPAPEMAWFKLELLYRQAAEIITPLLQPGDVLAAGDVGVLGYYTGAQILDTVGLNSAVSLEYYPLDKQYYVINYAIPTDLILDQQPRFVVVQEAYVRKTLLMSEDFLQQYNLLATLENDIYGSQGMLVFVRR